MNKLTAGIVAISLLWSGSALAEEFTVSELAPGIFVHAGQQAITDEHNQGDIANNGFIIGSKCVAVIDTGGSLAVGKALYKAVRSKTQLPVCYVINTHMHPDHVFGNAAFSQEQPTIIGHAKLPAALAARGAHYRNFLLDSFGGKVIGEIILPTVTVESKHELDLGERILELTAWPTAHTDNDLTVVDRNTGTLWLSDLLFDGHMPVIDGKLKGWLAVMDEIEKLTPTLVIPGHGQAAQWHEVMAKQRHYLTVVRDETRAAINKGKTLRKAVETVAQSEVNKWLLSDHFHRRNITTAYTELEWED